MIVFLGGGIFSMYLTISKEQEAVSFPNSFVLTELSLLSDYNIDYRKCKIRFLHQKQRQEFLCHYGNPNNHSKHFYF